MGDLERRLERLEQRRRTVPEPQSEEIQRKLAAYARELWEEEMQDAAYDVAGGLEPDFTMNEEGDRLYALDGRLAVWPEGFDLEVLHGPRTEKLVESMPEGRWERFLSADEGAAEIVEELTERARDAEVPEDYRTWLQEREAGPPSAAARGLLDFELGDPELHEEARCLAWVLIHAPEALAMLSDLLRRRDAFVAEAQPPGPHS